MTLFEGLLTIPGCLPQVGNSLVRATAGEGAMRRFAWGEPEGFYALGMARRWELTHQLGAIDPAIVGIAKEELKDNWWRHIVTTFPIAWCGMWVGKTWGLLLIPVFIFVIAGAIRRRQGLLLAYAAPAIFMGLAHGAVGNQNTRYNLGFIGPIAVAAAVLALRASRHRRWVVGRRRPATAPTE
jgi:hypothetical protein